jgi:16S rRNA (guanine527-N7)-methyltransferase
VNRAAASPFRDRLEQRLRDAGLTSTLAPGQLVRLEQYYQLLSRWNRRINLTSLPLPDFPAATLDRLLVEPLIAAGSLEDIPASWFDLGSGGGSPAIPLKVVRPAVSLTMVESSSRKAAFLREAVHVVGLSGAVVLDARVEALSQRVRAGTVDIVTVRAVRIDEDLITAVSHLLKIGGRLLLFGSDTEPAPPGFRISELKKLPGEGDNLSILRRVEVGKP